MEDNQKLNLADLDNEAAELRSEYHALEERAVEFSKYSELRAVSVAILLIQQLFKLTNDVIGSLEMLSTPAESTTTATRLLTLEQIFRQTNWPDWLKKRISEDSALGKWYQKFYSSRPQVAKWLEVANTATIPGKIDEFKELNKLLDKIISRTEVLISFSDEYSRRVEGIEAIQERISAIPMPWSNYSQTRQGKFLLAQVITDRLFEAIEDAGDAFDEVNLMQAHSSVVICEKVMCKYPVELPSKRRSIRRLSRQYRKLTAPLEQRFGAVPHALLLTNIEAFCLQLQQIDLLLSGAEESLEAA